jgi:tetratricopeptide (TPR) repeat protein
MLMGKNEQALEICKLALKEEISEKSAEIDVVKMEISFIEGCLSRALGKISGAIEAFDQVLKQDSNHSEAYDHLYGFTCGLLSYKARNSEEDVLIQAYRKGNYARIIDATLENLWTRWLGDETVMTLLISSLAGNFNASALYNLGQRSVNQRPNSSVSWYCVGLFYQVTGRSDEARRYLFKAGIGSKINKSGAPDAGIGPAWIALGHSFAAYGDHDQAVSAYVAGVKSHCPGSVDPSLFLAIEYLRVRQPILAGAYLIDAHNCDSSNTQVLNELACLQAGKENYSAAKKFLSRAVDLAKTSLPIIFQITFALNLSVARVKEIMNSPSADADSVKMVLDDCAENVIGPFVNSVKKTISSTSSYLNSNPSVLSLFPWTANSAHPSAEHTFLFSFCVIQEWRALLTSEKAISLTEEALEGYQTLLECRNEHRNSAMEAVLIERQHRLLTAYSTLSVNSVDAYQVLLKPADESFSRNNFKANFLNSNYKTPRTPLIRSHSMTMLDSFSSSSGSNLSYISSQIGVLQTPILSFSSGALPTASALGLGSAASSIAASVSRRRLSLRRQMTGLRFDPAETSASFSSFESDNSFTSTAGISAIVTSTQVNEDLMMTASSLIENQSMLLIDATDIEADCELTSNDHTITEPFEYADEEDMRLDSD